MILTVHKKNLTPQDIFEYKKSWSSSNLVQVDCDSYHWSKEFCLEHFQKHDWEIRRYTKQDDSHTISFANAIDKDIFIQAYQTHNPKFDTGTF